MEKTAGTEKEESFAEDLVHNVRSLFRLRADTDEQRTIEEIRHNVDFKSANAWTLVFAIFIASIGLNINSTAVIIGAMLISPLMGPILGAGLALGINDYALLKRSLRNLAFAMVISVAASALYFLLSPLSEVQSELLARTRPTFYDVLIAVAGGAAGIIALSRTERGNAIPGVAIATALMPPLCTAGFGLASGTPKYFFGAIYLFIINSVFISISTFIFVRYMKFRKVTHQVKDKQRRLDHWVMAVALVVVVPSLVLAWILQQESAFRARANDFINHELKFDHSFLVGRDISYNWNHPKIVVDMIGDTLTKDEEALIQEKLKRYLIPADALQIRQTSIAENLEKRLQEKMNTDSNAARQLELKLGQAESELKKEKERTKLYESISAELAILMPKTEQVLPSGASEDSATDPGKVLVLWKSSPTRLEKKRVEDFLTQRLEKPAAIFHSRRL